MNSTLELSAFKLILSSSLFTKLILLFLLSISILSWAIMFRKYLFIKRYKSDLAHFLKTLTNQKNIDYLEDCCAHFSTCKAKTMPIIILRLIRSLQKGNILFSSESIMNNATMHEADKLQKGMGILSTTANISPLIGLLGTVWGVMSSFMSINQQGSANIAVVAPGIAEALMTTIAGLCVAIPAMAGHNLLSIRINTCLDYIDRINEYALSFLKKN